MNFKHVVRVSLVMLVGVGVVFSAGCVPKVALPEMMSAPKPQPDANGEYISPYTSDGVMCEWTDKMANVSLASSIGGTVAAVAIQQGLRNIPIAGAFLGIVGDKLGAAAGRKIAIESVGGWDYIKSKTDQSFATMEELAMHMYATYCYNEHYNSSLGALMELYPELKQNNKYNQILVSASSDICNGDNPKCVKISELGRICGTGKQIAQKASQDVQQIPATDAAKQENAAPSTPAADTQAPAAAAVADKPAEK